MQSFRTEIENPIVEKDILDLEKKIRLFNEGKIDPEKFRSLRLARGVYGQRQSGVQMVRIKFPLGRITVKQLLKVADISDEYSTGNLHLTTRQDVQIHYVSLDRTPELWAKLEQDDITLREACGNTVRNITASSFAGVDPQEPFDITAHAQALFKFFLRNPIQEDLGRKFKIAFSSSDTDTALTFIHDLGFIPKVRIHNGTIERGFKVLIGGGLGAQPIPAKVATEFLPEAELLKFSEAVVRVFDRYGERNNRHKARLKYLIAKEGLDQFLKWVDEERVAVKAPDLVLPAVQIGKIKSSNESFTTFRISQDGAYQQWLESNTFLQKQPGYFSVGIRVPLGNISSTTARKLAAIIENYAADEFRITVNQSLLLRFVPETALPALYKELRSLNLAAPGFDSTAHITSCPGTDTCNLGISNSTGITKELEKVIAEEYPDLIYEKDLKIKISGCMNSCGQHSLAHIGFHGSSLKTPEGVVPALQILLGGGTLGNGEGRISEKVIKVPSKRGPAVLRELLDDFLSNQLEKETFHQYYGRKGNHYFFHLLKDHADLTTLGETDFTDWGGDEKYKIQVGVGECAGVKIDLLSTLLFEAEEKAEWADIALSEQQFADAVYHAYSVFIQAAKTLLLSKEIHSNSQHSVLVQFEKHFGGDPRFAFQGGFSSYVLRINKVEADKDFAHKYIKQAKLFLKKIKQVQTENKSELILN